jgi:hypothetical protein
MGGLVASKYISKSTTNKNKVEKLITMGTPYLGSPKVLHVLETGNFFNDSKDTLMHEPIKFIGNNLSALYQLLPTKKYFSLNNTYYVKKYVEGDWYPGGKKEQNIDLKTYDDTKKLISQRNWALSSNNTVKRFFVDAENFHDSLFDNNSQVVKSVDSYLIIGYDKDTIMKVTEKYKKDGSFKEIRDIIKLNGGDGTVPVTSANIGGTVSSDKTYYIREEHGALPRNNNVIDLVVNIINGNTSTFDQNTISKTLPTKINEKGWFGSTKTRRVEVKVECPVRLEIYDEINNFVGTADDEYIINSTSDYGTFDTYGENNDKKMAYLQDGVYNVKLVGKSLGLMNLSIKLQDAGYDIKTILFNDVPVTETTVFTTNTDFSSNILLYVDSNNDGIIDNTINPTDIINGDISSDYIAPNIISTITGSQGKNDWYISDIKYDLSASDNLGVKDIEYIFKNESNPHLFGEIIEIVDEGTSEIYATAVDYNNNRSIILNDVIHVDKSAPTININIEEGSEFLLNQKVDFTYSAFDEVSGIESISSSLENNSQIDTSTVGEKTITVIATDFAGNQSIKTIKYKVKYSFEGIIKPINSDGSSVFKFGRAIPVKFQLKDYAGNNSSIANAKLYLEKIADLGAGTFIEAVSSGNSNTDNIFRYDNKDEQYIFNLNTSNMSVGTWKLKIILDDHSEYDIKISLK